MVTTLRSALTARARAAAPALLAPALDSGGKIWVSSVTLGRLMLAPRRAPARSRLRLGWSVAGLRRRLLRHPFRCAGDRPSRAPTTTGRPPAPLRSSLVRRPDPVVVVGPPSTDRLRRSPDGGCHTRYRQAEHPAARKVKGVLGPRAAPTVGRLVDDVGPQRQREIPPARLAEDPVDNDHGACGDETGAEECGGADRGAHRRRGSPTSHGRDRPRSVPPASRPPCAGNGNDDEARPGRSPRCAARCAPPRPCSDLAPLPTGCMPRWQDRPSPTCPLRRSQPRGGRRAGARRRRRPSGRRSMDLARCVPGRRRHRCRRSPLVGGDRRR